MKVEPLFIWVLILLHAIFFLFALTFANIFTPDSPEYLQQAVNILYHGSFYAQNWDHAHIAFFQTLRPPLYGLFIMVVKLVVDSNFAVLFVQDILSIFTLIAFNQFLKKRFPGVASGMWLCLGLLFFPRG